MLFAYYVQQQLCITWLDKKVLHTMVGQRVLHTMVGQKNTAVHAVVRQKSAMHTMVEPQALCTRWWDKKSATHTNACCDPIMLLSTDVCERCTLLAVFQAAIYTRKKTESLR